jgi:hypothetical protein
MKKFTLVYKKTTSNELIDFSNPNYNILLNIILLLDGKINDFKTCVKSFPKDSIVSIFDF